MTAPESPLWFTSSYSSSNGGNCVEVAWFKSSYSGGNGGNCVEVSFADSVGMRDSKYRAAGHLAVSSPAWHALLDHALSRNPRTATKI